MVFPPAQEQDPSGPIGPAAAALRAGRLVAVADSPDRESEVDLVLAAQTAGSRTVAAMVRHGSGFLCAAMAAGDLDRLALPPMAAVNEDPHGTAYAVSCDAAEGIGTGISAADRARTLRVLADPASGRRDLRRPGHVVPLRARPGGVLERAGHTEAAVDLARAAGLVPAAGIVELVEDDGSMLRHRNWPRYAAERGLSDVPLITVEELAEWRRRTERHVQQLEAAQLPTASGTWRVSAWRDAVTGEDHLAMVLGDVTDGWPVLVRVHSECLTGEALRSLRCDCGPQLDAAQSQIAAEGRGIIVYLHGHEGRGIGLAAKIAAYARQDAGADTVEANLALGLPSDGRRYHAAGQILTALGVREVRVLTNNPAKTTELAAHVSVVSRQPLVTAITVQNRHYLATKRDRMDHDLPDPLGPALTPPVPARPLPAPAATP